MQKLRQSLRCVYLRLTWLIRHEMAVLVYFAVFAGGTWGFIALAKEVEAGATRRIDAAILLAFRNPDHRFNPIGPVWVEAMMRDVTALGSTVVVTLILLGTLGYLLLSRRFRIAWFPAVTVPGAMLINSLLKVGFARPRPHLVPAEVLVSSASFPSGHSMMAAVTYLTLAALLAVSQPDWRLRSYLQLVAVLILVLVGISRIYLGVHWPTDVLGGWMAGAAWMSLCWLLARWWLWQ